MLRSRGNQLEWTPPSAGKAANFADCTRAQPDSATGNSSGAAVGSATCGRRICRATGLGRRAQSRRASSTAVCNFAVFNAGAAFGSAKTTKVIVTEALVAARPRRKCTVMSWW